MAAKQALDHFDKTGQLPDGIVDAGIELVKEVVLAIIGKRKALRKESEAHKEAIRMLLEVVKKHEEILKKNGLL